MNYRKANLELSKEFGVGQVEVRKADKDAPWEYTLWFRSDNPGENVIERAKEIVNDIEPTLWMEELAFHSD